MKYVLRICVVFIFLSAKAYAQPPVSFRVKAGAGLRACGGSKEDGKDLGKAKVNMLYLELPIMLSARLHLTKTSNLVFSGGPYMAYGVGGKTSIDVWLPIPGTTGFHNVHKEYKLNTFGGMTDGNMGCKRFDAGVGLGIAYEYRRIVVDLEGQLGLVKVHDGVSSFSEPMDIIEFEDYALKNLSAFITVGYKF